VVFLKNSIKTMRERAGLTQTVLAEKMGVDQSAISQWEQGFVFPTVSNLKRLANILSCSTDELLTPSD